MKSCREIGTDEPWIAARFTLQGTHEGDFLGVPATGKLIAVEAVNLYCVSNGKIVDERGKPDLASLMQQIGAAPVS